MGWGTPRRPKISTKLGNPNPREGSDGDIQIKGTRLGAKLWGKWSGRWWDVPLSKDGVTKFGVTDSNYLSIDRDSVDIFTNKVKVATFGATTTVADINLTGKIGITSTGSRNVMMGVWAATNPDVSGVNDNVCIGTEAGRSMSSGAINNVCIGTNSGYTLSTSVDNVLIGKDSGYSVSTGNGDNVCIGRDTGYYMSTGYDNVFIGDSAGKGVSGTALTGNNNVAIGDQALYKETVGAENVAIGSLAMYDSQGGDFDVAIGYKAGTDITTAQGATLIGYKAGEKITDGISNTCIGASAGSLIVDGVYNTCVGRLAGDRITDGGYNICLGWSADASGSAAIGQIVIGTGLIGDSARRYDGSTAGLFTTTIQAKGGFYIKGGGDADDNTGFDAACLLSLDTRNTDLEAADVIGAIQFRSPEHDNGSDSYLPGAAIWAEVAYGATFAADNNETDLIFATAMSETALATAQEKMRIEATGRIVTYRPTSTTTEDLFRMESDVGSTGNLKWIVEADGDTISDTGSYTSDERIKQNIVTVSNGLDKINALRGVTHDYKYRDSSKGTRYGLIAQEVEQVIPELVRDNGLDAPQELQDIGIMKTKALNYTGIIPVLVEAVKELSTKLDTMQTEINTLK